MRKNAAILAGWLLITGLAGVDHARAAVEQVPWLGVYMQELTPELREGMDYRGDGGVILARVIPDGPAARAGLRKGDVVARVNSRRVDSPAELQGIVRKSRVGQRVSVEVFREGARRVVPVRLTARPGVVKNDKEVLGAPDAPETPDAPGAIDAPAPPTWHVLPSPDGQRRVKRIVIQDGQGLEGLQELDLPEDVMGLLGTAGRGRLGVRIESLSPKLGDYFGLKDGKGVLVLEVLEDTPAERAGLEAGDIITGVGEESVANGTDLVGALRGKEGKVTLRVVRHGTPRTIEAELEKSEPAHVRILQDQLGDRPGVQKRIILRGTDRGDLRHELDRLEQQVEELRQRLDEEQGDDKGE
jgi:predicted metalloprotease with PDZ domain